MQSKDYTEIMRELCERRVDLQPAKIVDLIKFKDFNGVKGGWEIVCGDIDLPPLGVILVAPVPGTLLLFKELTRGLMVPGTIVRVWTTNREGNLATQFWLYYGPGPEPKVMV